MCCFKPLRCALLCCCLFPLRVCDSVCSIGRLVHWENDARHMSRVFDSAFAGHLCAQWHTGMGFKPSTFAWRLDSKIPMNLAERVHSFINHDFIFLILQAVTVDPGVRLNRHEYRAGTEQMMHTSFLQGKANHIWRMYSAAMAWSRHE